MICTLCPNGCNISYSIKNGGTEISGALCNRGVALLKKSVPTLPMPIKKLDINYNFNTILDLWNKKFLRIKEGKPISGSPERSLQRFLVVCDDGEYILEKIARDQREKRLTINQILRSLPASIPSTPYLEANNNTPIQEIEKGLWMLTPFLTNTSIDRDKYWSATRYGDEIGGVLAQLLQVDTEIELPIVSPSNWWNSFIKKVKLNNSDLYRYIEPHIELLSKELIPHLPTLPHSFSHGDLHPMNILWDGNRVKSVIDWEFVAIRPRIYDTALAIGCIGTESREALEAACVGRIIDRVSPFLSKRERELLPLMILLNRFNWLNEWLRKKDAEMLEFELSYMDHIRSYV